MKTMSEYPCLGQKGIFIFPDIWEDKYAQRAGDLRKMRKSVFLIWNLNKN